MRQHKRNTLIADYARKRRHHRRREHIRKILAALTLEQLREEIGYIHARRKTRYAR